MMNQLQTRDEIPIDLTWDLTSIYPNEDLLLKDLKKVQRLTETLESQFKGKLNTSEQISTCLNQLREILELENLIENYVSLALSVDYTNNHYQDLASRVQQILSTVSSKYSFVACTIAQQPTELIQNAMKMVPENANYLAEIIRHKPYNLSTETEKSLSALSQTLDAPFFICEQAKHADMSFPSFTVDGKEYPLSYTLYEDNYSYEQDTKVRRQAFASFSKKLSEYQHTTAATYFSQVQMEKTLATLRGFDSVFDYLLYPQNVTRELYDRQIDLITEKLAPHMRKYARLIKRVHHLDCIHFSDLKIAVDPEFDPSVTIKESQQYIENGLRIMGTDYIEMIQTAYRDRWIDFAQNKGKSTGGFCASPYGKNSFILLSWNNKMSDVFTLAHELGHAGHFKLCNSSQSIFDTEVSNYFVEAPSTMNELLMAHYLLKTSEDKRFKRWVLTSLISNTYYHNFVTHLLEAAYQREVYTIIDQGGSVQSETLNKIMYDTLQKFWGEDVILEDEAKLTWMRQPHYYMGLYSYTYSAGLTVATQVCKRIETEGQTAIEDWKNVLLAGGTKTPIELAKMAGVDLTTDKPLLDTIEYIGSIIDEICSLTEELETL